MSAPETAAIDGNKRLYPDGSMLVRCAGGWHVACGPDLAHNAITGDCQAAQARARQSQTQTQSQNGV